MGEYSAELERMMEHSRLARMINCPHCNVSFDPVEHEHYEFCTYHGEEGPLKINCIICLKEFFCQEMVERTYESYKTEEEFE